MRSDKNFLSTISTEARQAVSEDLEWNQDELDLGLRMNSTLHKKKDRRDDSLDRSDRSSSSSEKDWDGESRTLKDS